MKNKRRAKMPDEKGTIIELTEEQKEQMRQATGQEHEGIRVETIGSELAPRLAPRKSLKRLEAKKSLKKLEAKKSLKKLEAKKSLKKLQAKKSLKKLQAKKSLKKLEAKKALKRA
jgi:hypothetical protein